MDLHDRLRWEGELLVLDGVYASTYNVDTVDSIDANLESLRHRPDHPDINLLLDARLHVAVLNGIWSPHQGVDNHRHRRS